MLHDVLRLLRIANDLSIKELSDKIDVSVSYIYEIEKGVKKPSLDIVGKYSEALNVSKSTIMYFDEQATENSYNYQNMLLQILKKLTIA